MMLLLRRYASLHLLPVLLLAAAQSATSQTGPAEGIRDNTPRIHAFTNARIVQKPGMIISQGTLVVRNGVIVSVGSASPPADARVWDMTGKTLYAGLIDARSSYGMPEPEKGPRTTPPPAVRGARGWNPAVKAERSAADLFRPDPKAAEQLRSSGITSTLTLPTDGVFLGTSVLVNVGDGTANEQIVRTDVAHHVGLSAQEDGYPGSLMGAIALIRQTLIDVDWYRRARAAYEKNSDIQRPEEDDALEALQQAASGTMPVMIETSSERDALRAHAIGKEFGLNILLLGSGREYRRLDAVRATGRVIALPLDFPPTPAVQSPEDALRVSLAALRHWDEAPENPGRLARAGVPLMFTSRHLKDPSSFLRQVRTAVARGMTPDEALAALTTTPARIFGAEKRLGSLEQGRAANFIVTTGDLFDAKTVIEECWIDGRRYPAAAPLDPDPRGTWRIQFAAPSPLDSARMVISGPPAGLRGILTSVREVRLSTVSSSLDRLNLAFRGDTLGVPGLVRLSAAVGTAELHGTGEWPDGKAFTWTGIRTAPPSADPDTARPPARASFSPVFPFGEFGRPALPAQPDAVLFRNGTLWTCGPEGTLQNADLLIRKGKIARIGRSLTAPGGAIEIDATGKHITPGIIDAHSHTAVDGAVNEATQAITAEVRIGDVLDDDDISIYRQLAGGVTTALVLHGSANPIGGQSQVIKLRWGALPDELKFDAAAPTIKFALGENPKQANWGPASSQRYPKTRMGVEQIIRDEFRAALDYQQEWKAYEKNRRGLPPRRDLELDAILEIIEGKRMIHCHSYRQDEVLAMMRVAEEFGFRVAVFTHILEGFKVADVMAAHGAGGSSFSDWWGYKFEVYDAIPYNPALMYEQGVLTTLNSDSDELARRLNLEAAKAVKYGGVPDGEALKMVTLNSARQLKVDRLVGSLEEGKDADIAVWSGNPLSTYTMCEQTWIDGRRYFDRDEDRVLRDEATRQRAALIQKALEAGPSTPAGDRKEQLRQPYSCHDERFTGENDR